MKYQKGTEITFENDSKVVVLDTAELNGTEYAYCYVDTGDINNPAIAFLHEAEIDGEIGLEPVVDGLLFAKLCKKFKVRNA